MSPIVNNKLAHVIVLAAFSVFLTILALISIKIAAAVMIGIAGLALVFFKPFYGLLLFLALLYIRPQDFVPALEKFRIVLVLAVVLILRFISEKIVKHEEISVLPTRQHVLMFILLALVPISNIVNGHLAEAWDGLNEFLTLFLIFFIIIEMTDSLDKFRKVYWTIVAYTVFMVINGIIMYFKGTDLVGNIPKVGTRIAGIGIFGDPNDFALAVNSVLPFVLVKLFSGTASRIMKIVLALITVIFIAAIVFTDSRGGYIAFILVLGFFAVYKWGFIKGAFLGLVFIAAAFAIAPSRMGDLDPYGASAGGRVYAWISGLVLLKSHPILGIGYGNFTSYVGRASHSAFIQCMADLGLIGYFFWIALLYSSFMDIRVVEKINKSPYKEFSFALLLSLIGFLGGAVFLSQAYSPMLYIIVALITASLYNNECPVYRPKMLLPAESLRILIIMGLSVVGYKVLAMVY